MVGDIVDDDRRSMLWGRPTQPRVEKAGGVETDAGARRVQPHPELIASLRGAGCPVANRLSIAR